MITWHVYTARKKATGKYYLMVKRGTEVVYRPTIEARDDDEAEEERASWERHSLPGFIKDWEAEHGAEPEVDEAQAHKTGTFGNVALKRIFDNYTESEMPANGRKPRSIHKHKQQLRDFELWLSSQRIGRIQQVSREVLKRYQLDLMKRGRGLKTVHNYMTTIRAAFNAAKEIDMIEASPFRSRDLPSYPESEMTVYSPTVISALLFLVREHDPVIYPPVLQIATTGNRPSEVVNLLARQVNLEGRYIRRLQCKVKRLATYAIGPEVVKAIRGLGPRKPDDYVYLNEKGKPWTDDALYNRYVRLLEKTGFPHRITFLNLRNSYATNAGNDEEKPTPVQILQAQMGHSNIQTTLKYIRSSNQRPYVDYMEHQMSPDQWKDEASMLKAIRKKMRGTA